MSLFNQIRGLNIINTTNETISFFNESDELIRSYEPNDCCITVE